MVLVICSRTVFKNQVRLVGLSLFWALFFLHLKLRLVIFQKSSRFLVLHGFSEITFNVAETALGSYL